jgi:general secretion pathway protein M
MTMNLQRHRARIAVGSTLAIFVALLALAAQYVWSQRAWAVDQLAEVEPRYARLLGLRAADAQLDARLKQARTALTRLGYGSDRDAAQIGNDLQQKVRSALQAAGMTVSSSQVLPVKTETKVDRVSVAAQVEGPLNGLQVALAALQAETPALSIDGLQVQATNKTADSGIPIVSCRITVGVLRLQS